MFGFIAICSSSNKENMHETYVSNGIPIYNELKLTSPVLM